jgi:UDP-N-acetylglucosamine--N-acetylmuramyl-(pentapeptide) pyrophosphoryl-undecaprenol N-acetylglucosamine transferase
VFSKGGFVTVPVVMAARMCRVPVIVHESDLSPGLANRISSRFASKICVSFPETARHFGAKAVFTGAPIRAGILSGDRRRGLELTGFSGEKPVVLVMGGSQGSRRINAVLRESLEGLMEKYNIIHLCGKGNMTPDGKPGYKQFEYLSEGLADVFACSDVIISRAGANSIFEFLALRKPNLLIPLPLGASRGDQIDNARLFAEKGFSAMMNEEALTPQSLSSAIDALYAERDKYAANMAGAGSAMTNGVGKIVDLLTGPQKPPNKSGLTC